MFPSVCADWLTRCGLCLQYPRDRGGEDRVDRGARRGAGEHGGPRHGQVENSRRQVHAGQDQRHQ